MPQLLLQIPNHIGSQVSPQLGHAATIIAYSTDPHAAINNPLGHILPEK